MNIFDFQIYGEMGFSNFFRGLHPVQHLVLELASHGERLLQLERQRHPQRTPRRRLNPQFKP